MHPLDVTPDPEPTDRDRHNAEMRQQIAERQNAEYDKAYLLALGTLGSGWTPWMKLSLIESDHRRTGNTEPVATAYKVYRGEERLSEKSMYLRKMPDGSVKRANNYDELFSELLTEPHPTRLIEVKGAMVVPPRWSLVWSSLERYTPRNAEALAAGRVVRERNKATREQVKFERDQPLFAEIERLEQEEGRGR